jgi:outer membrane lipoprotein-sorting protein
MMTKLFIPVFLVFLVSLPLSAGAQTHTLDQLLAQMAQTGRDFRSMEASIERTKVTVIVNDKFVDSGKVYFTGRGTSARIKFEILKPEPQLMLIRDGKALLYYPKLKDAQEYSLGHNQDKAEFLLIGFGPANESISKYYDVTLVGAETVDGKNATVIDLKPKAREVLSRFKLIRLWIDPQKWTPVQTRVTEASNDYQIVKFSNIRMNSAISESVFGIKLPKDVRKTNMGTIKM